ncbi:MAG: DUF402 domain-containing protein, partial [Actinomycetota bacterium]
GVIRNARRLRGALRDVSGRRTPGDAVVLREFHGDRIWEARPALVVADAGDDLSFFIPEGTRAMRALAPDGAVARLPGGAWALAPSPPRRRSVLSFASTSRPHAVLAIWDAGWVPRCWYVNLQLPMRRTATGFDTTDLFLDLVGTPDGSSWTWKDEDELAEAVAAGLVDPATAERIRAEARDLADAVSARRPPFDVDRWAWRPDPAWALPELPADWDRR